MLNITDESLIDNYRYLTEQFTKFVGPFLYIICLMGTLMNIFTFSQRTFDRRACSFYLLVASACDFIHLQLDPLANILQYGFSFNWTINAASICTIKSYFAFTFMIISATLTTMASVSQYFLSSTNNRRWFYARRHIGIRFTKITFTYWFLSSIPVIFCSKRFAYFFQSHLLICSNPVRHTYCFPVQLIYICLFNGFLPPFIMMICGFLTYQNIRERHHHRSKNSTASNRIKRINQQLAWMLILQSIKSTIASVPYSIFNCYWLKTLHQHKTLLLQAQESLIHQIVYLLFWSNYTSFFVYYASSDIFRQQWIKGMKMLVCCSDKKLNRNLF